MNSKSQALLGFAAKAGRLSYGMDATVSALRSGKSHLVLAASDISRKSKKEIAFFADQHSVRFRVLEGLPMQALSNAVGRRCGILSINDSGFADAFLKAHEEGGNGYDQ